MIKDTVRNNRIVIISFLIVLIIGLIGILIFKPSHSNTMIKTYESKDIAFNYDSTWKIKEKSLDGITLKHSSNSEIIIQINTLIDEYKYSTIEELIDELVYSIQKDNTSYKLISKKAAKVTKDNYSGYKLLYENDTEQVMIIIYKKSDKLVTIKYEANNEVFDILLDSVHSIIYDLNIKDTQFSLTERINIKTANIKYEKDNDFDKKLTDTKEYEVANKHFYVSYTIPTVFELYSFDSTYGLHRYTKKDSNTWGNETISITTNVENRNIFEYIDKKERYNVFANYDYYRSTSNTYLDFKESLSKIDDGYVYINSYKYDTFKYDESFKTEDYKRPDSNMELIKELDNSHILVVKIQANGIPITEKLASMIKINSIKNYAYYINIQKEDNYLIADLKRYADNDKSMIDLVHLRVPDKYEEEDKEKNIYLERHYGMNYHEEEDMYDYNVHYELTERTDESFAESINNVYISDNDKNAKKITYTGKLTLNGKEFKVYSGGYTGHSGIMFTSDVESYHIDKKVLFYEMPDKGYLVIDVSGNKNNITNDILLELTNFSVEQKGI